MTSPRDERLTFRSGGWVEYQTARLAPSVFLRFEEREGRLVPVDLFLSSEGDVIDTATLRVLPLGRIVAWVNAPNEAQRMRERLSEPELELRRLFARRPKISDHVIKVPHRTSARLPVPEGRDYGDAFYRKVAKVYATLAGEERAPALVMSEVNGVSVERVHTWINQARKRGFLPPGQAGRAG